MKKAVGKGHFLVVSIRENLQWPRYMSKLQNSMPKPNVSKHLLGHRQDPLRVEVPEDETFCTENLRAKRSPKKEDDFGFFKWMKISGLRNGCSFSGVYLLGIEHGCENLPFLMGALHMRDFHAFPASHVSLLEIYAKGDCVIWCGWISLWWNIHF